MILFFPPLGGGRWADTQVRPYTGWGSVQEPAGSGVETDFAPAGRDGARPLQGDREWPGGGVRSPRPTEATQVVPSSGPM